MKKLIFAIFFAITACQTAPSAAFTPEQVAVLESNGFEPFEDGWMLGMSDKLLFPTDESRIADQQVMVIENMTEALMQVGIQGARVVGHTDSTGTAEYNSALSLERANAVKAAIVQSGMDEDNVRAEGAGESQPVESNATAAGRQENRRVAIIVTSIDAS